MTRNEEIFEEKEFYRAEKIDDVYWLRSIYVFLNTLLK